jgi:hypothetical protein
MSDLNPNLTFSNPRLEATFNDWPLGGNKRGQCVFKVETHPKRGQRVGRTTTGKTKFDTYSPQVAIVDGSDGRTYILSLTGYQFVSVADSSYMSAGSVHKSSNPAGYDALVAIIKQAQPVA